MPPLRRSFTDLNTAIKRVAPDVLLAQRFRRMTGEAAHSRPFRFVLELAYGDAG